MNGGSCMNPETRKVWPVRQQLKKTVWHAKLA